MRCASGAAWLLAHRFFQLRAGDFALGDDAILEQDDRNAPVVEVVKTVVGVHVGELRLVAKRAEEAEGLVAEVASLAGDQHEPSQELTSRAA
jgi:hypothetical protein